jgi:hypothetical protein
VFDNFAARVQALVIADSAQQSQSLVRSTLRAVTLITLYSGIVCWLTWPLAASMTSSLPAEGHWSLASHIDLHYSTWVLSYVSHALAGGATEFANANIFYPAAGTLFYGPAALGALPLFAPVFLATGNPVLATNLMLLLGIALTGVTMHFIVRRWTGSDLAGVVGAVTVIFNQWLIHGFVPTSPHWAALCILPLIAYFAATRLYSMRAALLLVPIVVLQCLTDIVYVAPAVFGPLGVLAALKMTRRQSRPEGLRLLAVLVLALLALAPVFGAYMTVQNANPDWATQTVWGTAESGIAAILPDRLFSGLAPLLLTPIAMGLVGLGFIAMLWRRRSGIPAPVTGGWAHGTLWFVVGGCMAQNTIVQIAGMEFVTPLGYFSDWVSGLKAIRVPSRLGIAGLVGLGILTGVAFAEISSFIRAQVRQLPIAIGLSWALAAIIVVFIYQAYVGNFTTTKDNPNKTMPAEYRLRPAPVIPDAFLNILQSEQTPLIELPLRSATDPLAHARAMFHSISHWRPLLNGYSSYWPVGFPERMTVANQLPAQDALDQLVAETQLSLIWVRTQMLRPKKRAEWISAARANDSSRGMTLVARNGPELLFAVNPEPATRDTE